MSGRRTMAGWSSHYSVLVTGFAVGALFLLGQWDVTLLALISDVLSPILALIALVMALSCVASVGVNRRDRLSFVWFFFMLTLLIWFISEVVFSLYPLVLDATVPYPSIADGVGLAGYAPLFAGLVMQIWPFRENITNRKVLSALGSAVLVSGIILGIAIPPIMLQTHKIVALTVSLAYPILDIAALLIAIPCLMVFLNGTFWKPFLFLVFGLVLALVAHILFGWTNLTGTYYYGDPLELVYDWGYLSATLGFYLRRQQYVEEGL